MTRNLANAILSTALLIVPTPFFAQAPPGQPERAHKTMRLTGCVEAGADAATFKLTHARDVTSPASPTAPPAPIGTAGQSGEYELVPAPDIDLKLSTYIDHKVELMVRPVELAGPGKTEPALRGADLVTPAPQSTKPALERVTVIAVTHLASSCP